MYGRRATNEDLTFRAAGGDGIVRPSVGRAVAVGLSHVKTRRGEKDHETNKFLANCHRRTTQREGRGETRKPFENKEREDDFGHRRDDRRGARLGDFELRKKNEREKGRKREVGALDTTGLIWEEEEDRQLGATYWRFQISITCVV